MKIAICQINTTVGDFQGNTAKVLKVLQWAKEKNARLAIFPELATFGYPPRDLLDKPYLISKNLEAAEKIARHTTKDFAAVFGFVARNEAPIGHGLFNAAAFAADGKILCVQPKTLLPTYDVFDEARHFDAATFWNICEWQGTKLGLSVCEDIWSDFDFGGRRYYAVDPMEQLQKAGAQLLINISASPFAVGKQNVRRLLLAQTARRVGLPIFYCNLVGGNDELVFDGGSLAVSASGEICWEGKRFHEENFLVDSETLQPASRISQFSDVEEVVSSLILGLKDYAAKCHFKKAVVGLSGGIDSSVVAALAVQALGGKNVTGISMPSPYSSQSSLDDATALAKKLGMNYQVIPIHETFTQYLKMLKLDIRRGVSLTVENIQARIRGNILMAISNQTGALVLSTGNKSELACGYCTLYGDLSGGFAILSDVPKTVVYEVAKFLNRKKKIISDAILRKTPSAELRPKQKDEDTLPPYPILDGILKAYIEDHASVPEIIKQGFAKKLVEEVVARVDHNEYKRRQSPPGIKVTSKAFGIGRRFPIAWEYR